MALETTQYLSALYKASVSLPCTSEYFSRSDGIDFRTVLLEKQNSIITAHRLLGMALLEMQTNVIEVQEVCSRGPLSNHERVRNTFALWGQQFKRTNLSTDSGTHVCWRAMCSCQSSFRNKLI